MKWTTPKEQSCNKFLFCSICNVLVLGSCFREMLKYTSLENKDFGTGRTFLICYYPKGRLLDCAAFMLFNFNKSMFLRQKGCLYTRTRCIPQNQKVPHSISCTLVIPEHLCELDRYVDTLVTFMDIWVDVISNHCIVFHVIHALIKLQFACKWFNNLVVMLYSTGTTLLQSLHVIFFLPYIQNISKHHGMFGNIFCCARSYSSYSSRKPEPAHCEEKLFAWFAFALCGFF